MISVMKIMVAVCCFLYLDLLFSNTVPILGEIWQCKVQDKTNKEWAAQSNYKIAAINQALDACKKQSIYPLSCRMLQGSCGESINGHSLRHHWQCTALDFRGTPWSGPSRARKDDAALAAKAYCRRYSTMPDTCYINLITCFNPTD